MPYYIKKPSILDAVGDVYYKGNNKWSDKFSERMLYTNRSEVDSIVAPTTKRIGDKDVGNTNGAFKTSTIVEE